MFKYVFAGRNGTLYAINQQGDLLWFRHLGYADGSNKWAPNSGVKIGSGWGNYKRLMASNNGVIYAIATDGNLYWYKHLGFETGAGTWANSGSGIAVGSDWASPLRVVVADDGILYVVRPNGNLDWFHHLGFDTGVASWNAAAAVGTGWDVFDGLEAGTGGILYARKPTGELFWYKHLGYQAGVSSWAAPIQVASSWNATARFAASNDGVFYLVRPNGALDWLRHDGITSGANSWRQVANLASGFGCLIGLQANNGQYICAEGGGGQTVIANRPAVGPWESFNLIYLDPNRVALQASNAMFACAEGGGGQPLVANRTAIGAWETFTLLDRGNGQIALQANNGQYVCAEGGGGQPLVANRTAVGAWETFTLLSAGDDFPNINTSGNAIWPLAGGGAIITDTKHGKSLVAGDVYDGHAYHQDPAGRLNAQWQMEPVVGGGFLIRDRKHGKCLVAGDVYDQHVYHQDPADRPNAKWNFVKVGADTYNIIDQKHQKAIVAGDVYDGNFYHQDPQGRPNALWKLAPVVDSTAADFSDPGTPTPPSGDASLDQDIKSWWNDGIEFLDSHVKVRWIGNVTTQQSGSNVVYTGRMEFAAPLSFTVDNVSFTAGKDPTGFFSIYILKIKLPIGALQLLDGSIRGLLEAELQGPLDQLARPALSTATDVYFILAKGAAHDDELGEIKYGLNLYAKLRMSDIEPLSTLDRLVPELGLKNKTEVFHVALCRQPLKSLLIEMLSKLEIPLGDGNLVLSEVTLTGSADLKTATQALGILITFRLTVGEQVLLLRGNISVDTKSVVTVWGALDAADGKWVEPFGIPGLSIGGFGVQMSLLPGPVVAGFGARGEVHFGDQLLGGSFAILRDPTQPVKLIPGEIADGKNGPPTATDPITVPAEVTLFDSPEGLNLPVLLAAFAPPDIASNPLIKNILNLSLTELNFSRANGPLTIAGQFYNRGWSFRARLNLWGYKALVEGKKSFTGIYLHGTFDPIRIPAAGKDFFALTSADGTTGPVVAIDAMISKQGLTLSGQITLFGGPSFGAEVTLDDSGFAIQISSTLGGLYGGAMLRFDGTSVRISQTVVFPYSLVVSGQTVTLSVSTLLSIEASLAGFKQTMSCSFDALGLHREMKLLELVTPFPGLSDVAAAFKQFFENDVKGIFGLLTWVPHIDSPVIPHIDGPMIPHVDAPIIPHGDVSFIPHTDGPIIPHGDVSFIPHADIAHTGHADAAAILHADIPASAHIDSTGYTHGDTNFIGIHTDWVDHPHGDSGLPHVDSPSIGHADGWAVPHIDSPSTAHVDTAQVLHADTPSSAHVDTPMVLHADTPATAHADIAAVGHMDDPGHWGS